MSGPDHDPPGAWHVVQQRQQSVRPTAQQAGGGQVNDDRALEHAADVLGAQAAGLPAADAERSATQPPMTSLARIEEAIALAGLVPRGALRLAAEEQVGALAGRRSLVLVGLAGRQGWEAFAASAEASDGAPDPLDRWSRRCLAGLARQFGAAALYPFGGPPYWPFQRWAQRAEPVQPSPLGLLIHPEYGLWHSYRGALAFTDDLVPADPPAALSPCATCLARPCLTACPVGAFSPAGYDVGACADWLRQAAGAECMGQGCQARLACPVGRDHAHAADQAAFGMRAFLAARG